MDTKVCFVKGEKKRAWSSEEDELLTQFVKLHGQGKWRALAQKAGLRRSGKSCRLRWLNYLRPGIKRGDFSCDEEELIIKLHRLLGNRWTLIAGRLPDRTDNEIKNYWNNRLCKKVQLQGQQTSSALSSSIGEFESNEKTKVEEEQLQTSGNVDGFINSTITSPQIQIPEQDNFYDNSLISSMEVFNSNEVTLNFDSFHENCNHVIGANNDTCIVSCNYLQDMEVREMASLLDIENELRELL